MAEYLTCFDGCNCGDCRQRRSDYFYMREVMQSLDLEEEQPSCEDRLESAMRNLGYSKNLKASIKKSYRK